MLLLLLISTPALAGTFYVNGRQRASATPNLHHNIIVVVMDDIGQEEVASYAFANPSVTPELDAMATAGLRFTHLWAASVCSPARAMLMTGQYPSRSGVGANVSVDESNPTRIVGLDKDAQTLQRVLSRNGYRTHMSGKWHLTSETDSPDGIFTHIADTGFQGYEASAGNLDTEIDGGGSSGTYTSWERCVDTGAATHTCATETDYAVTQVIDDAVAALSGTEPFFLYVPLHCAHGPVHRPPDGLISGATKTACDAAATDSIACHEARVEACDTEIGRLMDSVDTADTTVLVFSDNGTKNSVNNIESPCSLGHGKGTPYECSIRVPFIVQGKAVATSEVGEVAAGLVNLTDLYATILELAQINAEGAWPTPDESTSIVPIFADNTATVQTSLYFETFIPNPGPPDPTQRWDEVAKCDTTHAACPSSIYTLVVRNQTGSESSELFNITTDPFQDSVISTPYTGADLTAATALQAIIDSTGFNP